VRAVSRLQRERNGRRLRLRVHRRGQSLVELALVAPILVILLVGAAQVAAIAFGLVSIDSATREGARAGALAPNNSLKSGGVTWYSAGTPSHQCTTSDFQTGPTGNPICEAVVESAGTLKASLFTSNPCFDATQACVTITVLPPASLNSSVTGSQRTRLEASTCNGANATVTGVVNNMPGGGQTATVSDLTGDTQPSATDGTFTICVKANGSTTSQTLTAQVGSASCGGWSGSVGPFPVSSGATITEDIDLNAESPCPTLPPPTPTPTPTPVSCTNQQATVTGAVTPMPAGGLLAAITASSGETTTTDVLGNFSFCVKANGGNNNVTLLAQIGTVVCGGYNGSVGPFPVSSGNTYPEAIIVTAEPACATPTPPPGPAVTCVSETVPPSATNSTPDYIQVTVTYPIQIFVPFIGAIFQSQPGYRVITTTVTDAIEPCALTNGD
jgi:TadE-like protein